MNCSYLDMLESIKKYLKAKKKTQEQMTLTIVLLGVFTPVVVYVWHFGPKVNESNYFYAQLYKLEISIFSLLFIFFLAYKLIGLLKKYVKLFNEFERLEKICSENGRYFLNVYKRLEKASINRELNSSVSILVFVLLVLYLCPVVSWWLKGLVVLSSYICAEIIAQKMYLSKSKFEETQILNGLCDLAKRLDRINGKLNTSSLLILGIGQKLINSEICEILIHIPGWRWELINTKDLNLKELQQAGIVPISIYMPQAMITINENGGLGFSTGTNSTVITLKPVV